MYLSAPREQHEASVSVFVNKQVTIPRHTVPSRADKQH